MSKKTEHLVMVAAWFVDDNWYGKRYRAILTKSNGEGFKNMTEARKYRYKLKKYVKAHMNIAVPVQSMTVVEKNSLKEYEYISHGPSIEFKHYNITLEDLEKETV